MKFAMKKCYAVLLALLLAVSLLPVSRGFAADVSENTHVEDLGNGITVESVLVVKPSLARSSSKSASLTSTFKHNGVQIAVITLNAVFIYDGSTSRATYASYSKDVASGWTYANHSLTRSGNTAALTATLKNPPVNVPVDMKISCSPTGVITKG